jgi:hypothetical protein
LPAASSCPGYMPAAPDHEAVSRSVALLLGRYARQADSMRCIENAVPQEKIQAAQPNAAPRCIKKRKRGSKDQEAKASRAPELNPTGLHSMHAQVQDLRAANAIVTGAPALRSGQAAAPQSGQAPALYAAVPQPAQEQQGRVLLPQQRVALLYAAVIHASADMGGTDLQL